MQAEDDGIVITEEERYRAKWRAWGLTDEEITHHWEEFLVIEGYRDHLERQKIGKEDIDKQVAAYGDDLAKRRTWGKRM